MLKRVPSRRRKAMEMYPDTLDETVSKVREQIIELSKTTSNVDSQLVVRRLSQIETMYEQFAQNPPSEVLEFIREPWPSEGMLDALYRMTWLVLISSGPQYFITTDNPAFFFEAYGLATPKAEFSFPLSSTHVLHGCWQPAKADLIFLKAQQHLVREMNRRLSSGVERLAFYYQSAPWLQTILAKKNPYLSAIQW